MHNYKMIVQYDGTRYSGWQRQGNTSATVQNRMEQALATLLKEPVEFPVPDAPTAAFMPWVRWRISAPSSSCAAESSEIF